MAKSCRIGDEHAHTVHNIPSLVSHMSLTSRSAGNRPPCVGIIGAGCFEYLLSPAAFRAAEGVSVYSVVDVFTLKREPCGQPPCRAAGGLWRATEVEACADARPRNDTNAEGSRSVVTVGEKRAICFFVHLRVRRMPVSCPAMRQRPKGAA